MEINRKRVARRLASGLVAGALVLGGLAISGGSVSAKTPNSPTTNRIAGDDRYETAVEIARANITGNNPEVLIVASGESYADALAAAPLSNGKRTAILLVRKDSLPETVADYLSDIRANFGALASPPVFVIGGTSVISTEVEDSIKAALAVPGDLFPAAVARKAGDDRYATAKAIADTTGVTTYNDKMILVGGDNWADALAAGSLAANTGWPIALVPAGGIAANASTKALVDGYLALTSSVKQFVIFGGPAAVPSSVEEYLAGTKSVKPANIRRVAGVDRYQTSLLANVYLLTEVGGSFNGGKVALASGQSPWDAIAASAWSGANGVHIMLSTTAGGNPSTLALGATLAGFGRSSTVGNYGDILYVLGGKAAVSEAAKAGYVGSMGNDLTSTLSGCDSHRSSMTLTLSGSVSSAELPLVAASMASKFTLNSAAMTASVSAVSVPGVPARTIFTVSFSANTPPTLSATQTVRFLGISEDLTTKTAGAITRSIAGSTCSVVADTTRPAVVGTPQAWSGPAGNTSVSAFMQVRFSEPVVLGNATAGVGTIPAGSLRLVATGATNSAAASVAAMSSDLSQWLIALSSTDSGIPNVTAGAVIELAAAAVADQAGNAPALPIPATAAVDASTAAAPAVLTAAAVSCVRTTDATVTSGVAITLEGDYEGAAGNSWTMTVTNQRGLLIPTVTADATTKSIAIVADSLYHTADDIATVMQNNLLANAVLGNFSVSGGTTNVAATLIPAKASGGSSTCTILLSGNEAFSIGTPTVSVNNVPATATVLPAVRTLTDTDVIGSGLATSALVSVVTTQLGAGAMLFGATVEDVRGNDSTTAVTFTAS